MEPLSSHLAFFPISSVSWKQLHCHNKKEKKTTFVFLPFFPFSFQRAVFSSGCPSHSCIQHCFGEISLCFRLYFKRKRSYNKIPSNPEIFLLVCPSGQLPDVGMERHVLHRRFQMVQIILIKRLPKTPKQRQVRHLSANTLSTEQMDVLESTPLPLNVETIKEA